MLILQTHDMHLLHSAIGDQLAGLLLKFVSSVRGRYISFTSLDFVKTITKVQIQEQKLVFFYSGLYLNRNST